MGREIRRVPANWEHPKIIKTHLYPNQGYLTKVVFNPMYDHDYGEAVKDYETALKEWLEGQKLWNQGFLIDYDGKKITRQEAYKKWLESIEEDRKRYKFDSDYRKEEKMKYETGNCLYSDIAGQIPSYPDPDDYMPAGDWYQLFETVSEGTPLTPAFKTPQELVEWLANNEDYWGDKWTREQAQRMVESEWAPSGVVENGKYYDSKESLELLKTKE